MTDIISNKWFDLGFADGVEAGTAPIGSRPLGFDPSGYNLSVGHSLLEGSYNVIRRSQSEFQDFQDGASWMSGIYAGVGSVQAQIGFITGVDLPLPLSDGNTTVFVFVIQSAPVIRQ